MRTNLLTEMQRRRITISALAQTLGIHRNSMRNKLCDASPFTLDEAIHIYDVHFPDCEFRWLFRKMN